MITLYQAEWCPYSSAVRERLTELGIDFVARQVEPWPEQRTVVEEIPTLETEDGERIDGTRAIFEYLARFEPWEHERAHRERYADHREARAREATGVMLQKGAPL
ncbi:MAG TPA: glutathione S-transferase N-terminal domain-containing protein [Gaiellaceae bacterium]